MEEDHFEADVEVLVQVEGKKKKEKQIIQDKPNEKQIQ